MSLFACVLFALSHASRSNSYMATRLRSLLAPIAADLTGRRTRLCSRLFCTRSPRSGPPIPAWSNVLVLAQTSVPGPRPRCKPSIIRAIRCVEHVDRAVVENGDAEDARLAYRHLGLHTVLQWLRSVGRSLHEPPTYGAYGHRTPCPLVNIRIHTRGQRVHMVESQNHKSHTSIISSFIIVLSIHR